jgi:diguanylate cyclase (GGDEF)-like protein
MLADVLTEPIWATRDREADGRDGVALARDQSARQRDSEARGRDFDAYRRDRAAAERDRLAGQADLAAFRRDDPEPCVADRVRASHGRAAAARDRIRAADDRRRSARDRHMSALDRWHSAVDRLLSAEDRRADAGERGQLSVDDLTGLLRRRTGMARLQAEIDRAVRSATVVTVAFVDVDGLKQVNDSDGHPAGDALLRRVAKALRDCMRSYDVVMRMGGDEFVCGMVSVPAEVAAARFEQVAQALAPHRASVSVGLAELRIAETADALVRRADEQLVERRRSLSVRGRALPRGLTSAEGRVSSTG